MITALLAIALLVQGIPISTQQGGTISGVLKDPTGKPVPKVRIAAVAVPDSVGGTLDTAAMSALAETDNEGRFRLENVPPGKYYVAAGAVSLPTYYPGTQAMPEGRIVAVGAGANITDINFSMQATSIRDPRSDIIFGILARPIPPVLRIPLDIVVDDGSEVPVFGANGFPQIYVMRVGQNTPTAALAFSSSDLTFSGPDVNASITIDNLPPAFAVKSIVWGSIDLVKSDLRLSPGEFTSMAIPGNGQAGSIAAPVSQGLSNVVAISVPQPSFPAPSKSVPTLLITLKRATPNSSGVSVRGKLPDYFARALYISGIPGTLYWDGSFEFAGVPPGRHTIVAPGNNAAAPLGASIVVGDRDLTGIDLERTVALPIGYRDAKPSPAVQSALGAIPLATVTGKVIDKTTNQPLSSGTVFLIGESTTISYALNAAGEFRFGKLLPGTYSLETRFAEHESPTQMFTVGNEDVKIEIAAERP
jgi:hypothetical protein